MIAIKIRIRTNYHCNLSHNRDSIWLQSLIQSGPYMIAIRLNGDQIWLQSGKSSWSHGTMIFGRISSIQNFDNCSHIWSLLKRIEIIYGSLWISDCSHIESLLWPRLQSYLVLTASLIAIIFGPFNKNYCNHMWSYSFTWWFVN